MKLAHLLNSRADLNAKIEDHVTSIKSNSKLPEGQQPVENPNETLASMMLAFEEHLASSLTLNELNRSSMVSLDDEEWVLADVIVLRQNLLRRANLLKKFVGASMTPPPRWGRNELVDVVHLDVAEAKSLLADTLKRIRTIDNATQEINWTKEI